MKKVIFNIKRVMFRRRYEQWTYLEAFAYGLARAVNHSLYNKMFAKRLKNKYLKRDGGESYFDFNGAKLPDVSGSIEKMNTLKLVFEDVFLIPVFFNDSYEKSVVNFLDQYMGEGPYGYTDGAFDVTIKKNDIVIDAGAWIGDFSAYAACKGACVYAFEPVNESYQLLCKTKTLNELGGGWGGVIYPVQKGLGDRECEINISIDKDNSGGNSIVVEGNISERIAITTLDKFVKENRLERVDFIKADIEGAERDMLKGASSVLKTFAPKLAICTYHLPDDPEVLEKIILEANPDYRIVHLRHKLLATVVK
jgi:FkbM family methyltransferase